ncbi:Alpha/Beta hydrolase protein [Syncephalis plumigaleata]|nr:Alpha/Beta hydrolase protein [Syncephalis plumigaleata]
MIIATSPVEYITSADACLKLAYRRYRIRPSEQERSKLVGPPKRCKILLVHATGLCKELYTPLLDRLNTIEGEVIAMDLRNHGDSNMMNLPLFESDEATTMAFRDYYRDILVLVKTLNLNNKKEPLIGIGHSVGASGLLLAESAAPNTFSALIAIDPILSTVDFTNTKVITPPYHMGKVGDVYAALSANRRDGWANRRDRYKHFAGRGFYASWDEDVLKAYIEYGLYETGPDGQVALKMPPMMEADAFLSGKHLAHKIFLRLPRIKIPVLFLSDINQPFIMEILEKHLGHMLPLEAPPTVGM